MVIIWLIVLAPIVIGVLAFAGVYFNEEFYRDPLYPDEE